MLQEKNRSNQEFSQRTDALAKRLGVALNDLHAHTGFSSRMLYAYRTEGGEISRKAWGKLLAAEIKAGIAVKPPVSQQSAEGNQALEGPNLAEAAAMLRRQAAELLQTADRLDPAGAARSTEIKARATLEAVRRRASTEATQFHTVEQQQA